MAHPLYSKSLRYVNQPISVHHVDGRTYFGTLQRVTPNGMYLTPQPMTRNVSSSEKVSDSVNTAELEKGQKAEAKQVFFAPFFFPFAALTGFTLGFVAGARRAYYPPYPPYYPPYPYYRRPYPYYW